MKSCRQLKGHTTAFSLIVLACLAMSGCTTINQNQQEAPKLTESRFSQLAWPERWAAIRSLGRWQLTGKIGVKTSQRADSAVIDYWRQQGTSYEISLSSPILGLGKTVLKGNLNQLSIETGTETKKSTVPPQQLLHETTGWNLPLKSIPFWIKGVPVPGTAYRIRFDPHGNPTRIEQNGWEISPSRYQAVDGILLPGKVKLRRKDDRVTVIINEWKINPPQF